MHAQMQKFAIVKEYAMQLITSSNFMQSVGFVVLQSGNEDFVLLKCSIEWDSYTVMPYRCPHSLITMSLEIPLEWEFDVPIRTLTLSICRSSL